MKSKLPAFLSILLLNTALYGCLVPEKTKTIAKDGKTTIDSVLAAQLGSDEYGMKTYVMAFLKKGDKRWTIDSVRAANLQESHMENINRLAEDGKLIIAGPFLDDTDVRGIYIFDVRTVEEAQKLCETDPAIQAGSLAMELHPWYGSAALMKVPEIHPKITKKHL